MKLNGQNNMGMRKQLWEAVISMQYIPISIFLFPYSGQETKFLPNFSKDAY